MESSNYRTTIALLENDKKIMQETIEQLQASVIHAKWVSAMETIEQLQKELRIAKCCETPVQP